MSRANDLDALGKRQVKDDVLSNWEAAKVWRQFWPAPAYVGSASQSPEAVVNESGELIGVLDAVFGDEGPDLGEIQRRTWP